MPRAQKRDLDVLFGDAASHEQRVKKARKEVLEHIENMQSESMYSVPECPAMNVDAVSLEPFWTCKDGLVVGSDTHVYERKTYDDLVARNLVSPVTREPLVPGQMVEIGQPLQMTFMGLGNLVDDQWKKVFQTADEEGVSQEIQDKMRKAKDENIAHLSSLRFLHFENSVMEQLSKPDSINRQQLLDQLKQLYECAPKKHVRLFKDILELQIPQQEDIADLEALQAQIDEELRRRRQLYNDTCTVIYGGFEKYETDPTTANLAKPLIGRSIPFEPKEAGKHFKPAYLATLSEATKMNIRINHNSHQFQHTWFAHGLREDDYWKFEILRGNQFEGVWDPITKCFVLSLVHQNGTSEVSDGSMCGDSRIRSRKVPRLIITEVYVPGVVCAHA
jgi:hypothetical protein